MYFSFEFSQLANSSVKLQIFIFTNNINNKNKVKVQIQRQFCLNYLHMSSPFGVSFQGSANQHAVLCTFGMAGSFTPDALP